MLGCYRPITGHSMPETGHQYALDRPEVEETTLLHEGDRLLLGPHLSRRRQTELMSTEFLKTRLGNRSWHNTPHLDVDCNP